jgi:hypothetical protein
MTSWRNDAPFKVGSSKKKKSVHFGWGRQGNDKCQPYAGLKNYVYSWFWHKKTEVHKL